MNGYAVGSEALQFAGSFHHIGHIAASGISQCCNFIDVYTQLFHDMLLSTKKGADSPTQNKSVDSFLSSGKCE
jgi:hypothetical protein